MRTRLQADERTARTRRDRAAGLVDHAGLGSGDVDGVVLGQCCPNSEAPTIGRVAALNTGLDVGSGPCRSTGAADRACRS